VATRKKPTSVLESGAPVIVEGMPPDGYVTTGKPFWWQDDMKIVERALHLAKFSPLVWRRLRTLLVKFASADDDKRRELLADLQEIGKGKQGRSAPFWTDVTLVVFVNGRPEGTTIDAALERIQQVNPEIYPADLGSLRNRYYRVKKNAAVMAAVQDPSLRK
jgi:hypothetical protein